MLQRVLSREDHEELGERIGLSTDRHLPFLHRFEQGTLHLGGRTIHLIGEEDVGEYRAPLDREVARLLIVDQRADEVGRQEVRCELDPAGFAADRGREGTGRQSLGQPRKTLKEKMAVGQDPDHEPLEQHLLSNDDPADLVQCGAEGPAQRFDFRSAFQRGAGAETFQGTRLRIHHRSKAARV